MDYATAKHAGQMAAASSLQGFQQLNDPKEPPSFVGLSNSAQAVSEDARRLAQHLEQIMDRLLGSDQPRPASADGEKMTGGPRPVEPHLASIQGGIRATETYLSIIRSRLNRLADHVGVDHT